MNDQDYSNSEQNQEQDEQNLENQNSEIPSEPSVQQSNFQQAEYDRMSNMARLAMEQAASARADNERLQRELQQKNTPVQQEYNFDELNHRVTNDGRFAETTVDIVRRELQNGIRPLLERQQRDERTSQIQRFTAQAINAHPYAQYLRAHVKEIAEQMEQQLGNAEPNLNFVTLVLKGMISDALVNNPSLFNQPPVDNQNQANQNNSNNQQMTNNRPPMPMQPPTGRVAVPAGNKKNDLTEAEKKMKAHLDPDNRYTPDQFKELYYSPNQVNEFDLNALSTPKEGK